MLNLLRGGGKYEAYVGTAADHGDFDTGGQQPLKRSRHQQHQKPQSGGGRRQRFEPVRMG